MWRAGDGWIEAENRHQRQRADTDDVLYTVICRVQPEQFGLFEESSALVLLALIRFQRIDDSEPCSLKGRGYATRDGFS